MTNDLVCFTSSLVVQATEDVATFVSAREGHAVVHLAAAQGDGRTQFPFSSHEHRRCHPPIHSISHSPASVSVAAVQTVAHR